MFRSSRELVGSFGFFFFILRLIVAWSTVRLWTLWASLFEVLVLLLPPTFLFHSPSLKPPVASLTNTFRKVGHVLHLSVGACHLFIICAFSHIELTARIIKVTKTKKTMYASAIFFPVRSYWETFLVQHILGDLVGEVIRFLFAHAFHVIQPIAKRGRVCQLVNGESPSDLFDLGANQVPCFFSSHHFSV